MRFDTKAIHGGVDKQNSVIMPIHQTAGYNFESADEAAQIFDLNKDGFAYSRMGNPTVDAFEKRIAVLDGGVGALALASGMTAITYTILNLCRAGDNFVTSMSLYGGVTSLFNYLGNLGIEARFVDHTDPKNFVNVADKNTRLFFGETIPNPGLNVLPIADLAEIGWKLGIPLVVDNTCATPAICRPIEYGANIVVYSATKYLCGHGSSIGGVVVDAGNFDWAGNSNPSMNDIDASYGGACWATRFGNKGFIIKMRATVLRDMGGCLAPMNAFMFSQGLETLSLRMIKHSDNAQEIAEYLEDHPKVESVRYPGINGGIDGRRADKYLGKYNSGMIGVNLKGNLKSGKTFIEHLKIFSHVANIGDVRSMAIHPASTTHAQVSQEVREKSGIADGYIRLCVGIEDVEDLIEDLEQALEQI